jgi:hypothetical protein
LRASIRGGGSKTISGGLLACHDRMLLAQKAWISRRKSLPRSPRINLIELDRMEICMKLKIFRRTLTFALCACLLPVSTPAKADSLKTVGDEIVIGIVAVAGAITVGVIFAIHYHNMEFVWGCVASGPDGLALQNEGDQKTFQLLGKTADVKPGDRVRVKGKRVKATKGSNSNPTFQVEKLANDYGVCKVTASTP